MLHIDLEKDILDITIRELLIQQLKNNTKNPGQQKKLTNQDNPTALCEGCQEDLYTKEEEDADRVISYSKRFYGKILCRDCQPRHQKIEGAT